MTNGVRGLVRVGILAFFAIPGCAGRPGEAEVAFQLAPGDHEPLTEPPMTVERPWQADRMWELESTPADQTLTLRVTLESVDETGQAMAVTVDRSRVGRPMDPQQAGGPVVLTIDQPGASFTFAAALVGDGGKYDDDRGVCRVAFHPGMVRAAQQLDPDPSVASLLRVALAGAEAGALLAYAALDPPPTLAEVTRLTLAGVTPRDIEVLRRGGYSFSFDEMIALHRRGVSVDEALGFREAGFDPSAPELISLHEAQVTPDYAAEMRQLGVATAVDHLLTLKSEGITSREIATFKRAKYDLTLDQHVVLHRSGVKAQDALTLREAGYDFTYEELLKLRKWEVPANYAVDLVDSGFAHLTSDQIVELRLRRITPEMVATLRQQRSTAGHEVLAVPANAKADAPAAAADRPRLSDEDVNSLIEALD